MKQQRQLQRKPELTQDGKGQDVSSRLGTYSHVITTQLAQKYPGEIISIGDIAKVQYGRKAREGSHTEQYIRQQLTKSVNMLLDAGIPAIPIYDKHGTHKKIGIKVISEYNEEDYNLLTAYKEAAVTRGDLSSAKAKLVEKAMEHLRPQSDNNNESQPQNQ